MKVGQNVLIHESAIIDPNVSYIGNNVIIKENVILKKGVYIGDNCIIGEYQKEYFSNRKYSNPSTIIEENSTIRSNSIIYSEVNIGKNFNTGHFTVIRERVNIGEECSVGTYSTIANDVVIGNNSRIHTHVLITDKSTIGNNVWIFSNVITSSDIHPPCGLCDKGIVVGDNVIIGASSTFIPGINIDKDVVISSGSFISRNLKEGYLYGGNPCKRICEIGKIPCFKKVYKSAYPWNKREEVLEVMKNV